MALPESSRGLMGVRVIEKNLQAWNCSWSDGSGGLDDNAREGVGVQCPLDGRVV